MPISRFVAMTIAGAAALLALDGCATRATLTVYTVPAGGYVSEMGGRSYGTAPVSVFYEPVLLRQFVDGAGCFRVKGMESRWVSGATSRMEPIKLCGKETGAFQITLSRSPDAPGLDQDLQFELQLSNAAAQQQVQRQAAQAASTAATAAATAALIQSMTIRPNQTAGGGAAGGVGFLKRQYQSGLNRICIYDRVGSEVALTVGAAELCPLTF